LEQVINAPYAGARDYVQLVMEEAICLNK
jgi:hypothetical protein